MPPASLDYIALMDTAARRQCVLGLTTGRRKYASGGYRELGDLIVRPLGSRDPVDREPVIHGDFNGAATRLLRRLKR